ncbi:MAG TPA: ATP-binding cassette domain-containing protein [Candidatus Limnocylindrales bacterium]|nr:ATP-binding cassette domain-containing protein [Candidatus Limnocylindrales bacterium]
MADESVGGESLASLATSADGISVRGLTKHYGSILALDGLELDVPAGSVFGLLGPNGAGKTTTLRLLAGTARPTSGTAFVAGAEIGLDRPALRSRLGYLDQEPRYYGWMTGRQLLELLGRLHGLAGSELRDRVADELGRVGLGGAADRRIGGYSSGMRQRLGIAQALLHRPRVVLLDEPVASLDPEGRREVLELIAGLRGRTTVLFSSHILSDVERICDRVAILDRGRLVADAPLQDLLASRVRPVYRLVAATPEDPRLELVARRLEREPWVSGVTAGRDDLRLTMASDAPASTRILPLVSEAGLELDAFERVRPTLEDVFIELVGPPAAGELDGRGFVMPRQVGDRPASSTRPGPPDGDGAPRGRGPGGRGALFEGLPTLVRKELLEQWRTMRLLLTVAVFALVGLSSPLLARFTPDILAAVGGQLHIELPTPTAADAVGQLLKNLGQFGALTAIVLAMGAVAAEKERGTAALLLTHPASRAAFLGAKLIAIAVTLAAGTIVAAAGAWFYTLVLFEALPVGGFAASAAVQWLQLAAIAAMAFLGSTLTRSVVAAAGVAIAGLIVLAIVSVVPTIAPYLPTGLGSLAAGLALGQPVDPWAGPIAAVVGLTLALAVLAWASFRRQEL